MNKRDGLQIDDTQNSEQSQSPSCLGDICVEHFKKIDPAEKKRATHSTLELIFCEDDGNSLCVQNSKITEEDIHTMVNALKIQSQ